MDGLRSKYSTSKRISNTIRVNIEHYLAIFELLFEFLFKLFDYIKSVNNLID